MVYFFVAKSGQPPLLLFCEKEKESNACIWGLFLTFWAKVYWTCAHSSNLSKLDNFVHLRLTVPKKTDNPEGKCRKVEIVRHSDAQIHSLVKLIPKHISKRFTSTDFELRSQKFLSVWGSTSLSDSSCSDRWLKRRKTVGKFKICLFWAKLPKFLHLKTEKGLKIKF